MRMLLHFPSCSASRALPVQLLALLVALLALPACTHTHLPAASAADTHERINRAVEGQRGAVVLLDGQQFEAVRLRLGADSTEWVDPATVYGNNPAEGMGVVHRRATAEVAHVVVFQRGRGALQGLGIGLMVGVVMGALAGLTSGDSDALVMMFLGVPGGAVGWFAGGAQGDRTVYVLKE